MRKKGRKKKNFHYGIGWSLLVAAIFFVSLARRPTIKMTEPDIIPSTTQEITAVPTSQPLQTEAVIPQETVLTSHFFATKLTDEDLKRLTELLSCTMVTRADKHQIVMDIDRADLQNDIEDLLFNQIPAFCGQPGYSHIISFSSDASCQKTEIVVDSLDMTMEERQLETDIKLCSLIYSVLKGYPPENIRITFKNKAGNTIRISNMIG